MKHGKPDLHSCSLVSRSWNAITRRHLFRDVVYSFKCVPETPTDCGNQGRVSECHPYGRWSPEIPIRYKTFPMFCAFLRGNPAARSCVIRLKLDAFPEPSKTFTSPMYEDKEKIGLDLFTELLHLLPRLKSLRLCNIVLDARLIPSPSITLPSLDELYISYNTGKNYERSWEGANREMKMSDILECFAKVKKLHLFDCYDEVRREDGEPTPCGLELESLVIDCMRYTHSLNQYFAASLAISKLRNLTLEAAPGRCAQELFRVAAPQLEELKYHVRFDRVLKRGSNIHYTRHRHAQCSTSQSSFMHGTVPKSALLYPWITS